MSARLAYFVVFIGVLGHASSEFFSVLSGLGGAELSVWRFMLGAAGFVIAVIAFSGTEKLKAPLVEDGLALIGVSLFGVTGTYLAFHLALDFASIVQVGTVVTTIPIFVGIISLIVNKTELSTPKIITALAAICGVALLLTDGYLAQLAGDARGLVGIGLSIVCACLGAVYVVTAKPLIAKHGSIPIAALSTLIGAFGLWLIVGFIWNIWVNPLRLADMKIETLWPLLTIGLWNTTIAQLAWLAGLAAVPDMTRGSYLFFLKPVIAAFLAVLFLSQPLTALQGAAIAVICGAVLIEVMWPAPKKSRI